MFLERPWHNDEDEDEDNNSDENNDEVNNYNINNNINNNNKKYNIKYVWHKMGEGMMLLSKDLTKVIGLPYAGFLKFL